MRSEKVLHLVQRASKGCWCLFGKLCVHRWPISCGFSKFCTQNRAHVDRRFAQFRCRRCAEVARNLRALIQNTSDAVPCTLELLGKLWKALGACCAPKLRRDSSRLVRFPPKITAFESEISWQKAPLRSEKASHLVQRASKGCWCLFCTANVRRWPQSC